MILYINLNDIDFIYRMKNSKDFQNIGELV